VRLGNGDGTFQPDYVILPGDTPSTLVVAGINGDGLPDIAEEYGNLGIVSLLNLTPPAPPLTVVSAASLAAGPLAPNEIASAFASGILAAGQTASGGAPLPTTLAGVTVSVKDSKGVGQFAPLYFASASQVNFLLPDSVASGPAAVTISGGNLTKPLTAQVEIATVAPTLFSVGPGIAAGYAIQSFSGVAGNSIPLFNIISDNIVPVLLGVSPPVQLYLVLYGTGFDQGGAFAPSVSVQGVSCQVTYAGPQGGVGPGVDQLNLILPSSLAGSGLSGISLSIGGVTSNIVYVAIQ
jgi:uncharacterized protein (TIGR03437 family)